MKLVDLKGENACQFIQDVMENSNKFSASRWPQSSAAPNYSIEYSSLGETELIGLKEIENRRPASCRVILCQ